MVTYCNETSSVDIDDYLHVISMASARLTAATLLALVPLAVMLAFCDPPHSLHVLLRHLWGQMPDIRQLSDEQPRDSIEELHRRRYGLAEHPRIPYSAMKRSGTCWQRQDIRISPWCCGNATAASAPAT